jgi:hypothetical protein
MFLQKLDFISHSIICKKYSTTMDISNISDVVVKRRIKNGLSRKIYRRSKNKR